MNWHELREWVAFVAEVYICVILTAEYFYDANKDLLKKQKKTRTTKKTTTEPSGTQTTEETTETVEPTGEQK